MVFTDEHDKFLLKAYFRSGEEINDNIWSYSFESCNRQFRNEFPDVNINENTFKRHVQRIVSRFDATGTVAKGKSPGKQIIFDVVTKQQIDNVILPFFIFGVLTK